MQSLCFFPDSIDLSLFIFIVIYNLGPFDIMELPLQFLLIIDYVFNICIDFFRYVRKLLLPPAHQDVTGFDLVPLGHDIQTTVVLC